MRLKTSKAVELLANRGIPFFEEAPALEKPQGGAEVAGTLMVTVDPASHKILILLARKTVEDWGALAGRQMRELARDFLEPGEPADAYIGRELGRRAGFGGADQARLEKLVLAAHRTFTEQECIWVELRFVRNKESLAVTRASIEVNDEALFRHPDLEGAGEPPTVPQLTEREMKARAAGVEYLDLEGDIGILPGGIGFGMAALDIVRHIGGSPANVMDSGGEATPDRIEAMMDLLLDNPRVSAVFGCRYAGLTRADGWAKLMIQYLLEKKPAKPVVLRLAGNNEEEARKLFEEASQQHPDIFKKVWVFYSNTPADNAAREAVALAEMLRKGEDPFGSESNGGCEGHLEPGAAGSHPEAGGANGRKPASAGNHQEAGGANGRKPASAGNHQEAGGANGRNGAGGGA